jgi:F-type H+-transporting ATPase subunit epsilon
VSAESITIELCSPTSTPIEFCADEVVIPGSDGVMTILPGHTLLLTTLKSGVLIVHQGEEQIFFAVHGGFAEIAQDRIAVLADQLEQAEDIDKARAEAAKSRAEEILNKPVYNTSYAATEAALARALARIQAHGNQGY